MQMNTLWAFNAHDVIHFKKRELTKIDFSFGRYF